MTIAQELLRLDGKTVRLKVIPVDDVTVDLIFLDPVTGKELYRIVA